VEEGRADFAITSEEMPLPRSLVVSKLSFETYGLPEKDDERRGGVEKDEKGVDSCLISADIALPIRECIRL
jgi:hypothetical protein